MKSRTYMRLACASCQSFLTIVSLAFFVAGCGSPNAANIELRKKNQALTEQVDRLTQQHLRDVDALAASQRSHPTTPTLTPERLAQLFTTHGLTFGRLTGGNNPDSTQGSDNQLSVYVVPVDGEGTPIKAAGTFRIEAFDLGDPAKPLFGSWNFDLNQSRNLFFSRLSMYTYVLPCPLQNFPHHPNITIRVSFVDALTGLEFVDKIDVTVRLAAAGR